MSELKKTPYEQGSYERMITTLTSTQGGDSENNGDLEAPNRQQSPTQPIPEEDSVGPLSLPNRTKSGSSGKKKSKKGAKESKKSVLQAPQQHIDMGKFKSPKREKKESSSPKKPPPEKLNAENSIPLTPPESTSPAKMKKMKKKKTKAPVEKTDAQKSVGINEDKKMPPQKAKAQNVIRTDPSPQSDNGADKSIEKTRVTTRAASSSLASSASRSVNNKGRIGTISENESHNYDGDGDHSVSTAPLPPSLRVQDHHSLRPGAYRMYTGGVARYVDSAGDDIDDFSTSNDQSTAQSTTQSTNYSDPRVANTVDAVTIEAHLVEDPPPPVFRPAASEAITAHSNMAITSATPTGITYATVKAIEDEETEKDDAGGSWKNRKMHLLVCFGVFAIVIIASTVAASALRRNRGGNNGNINVDQLTDSMKEFIEALPQYTIVSLAKERSDQSKALDWIETYDDLDSFSLERNLQRFALISLLYATTRQDLSTEVLTWLAGRDECDWYDSECVDDIYTELSLQSESQLAGTIVPELALLTSLEVLLVDGNALVGTIPTELGEVTTLKKLRMNDNFFVGQIPTEFGNLSNLEDIDLSTNNLSGDIPTEIGLWKKVEQVMLANNSLEGTVPTEVGRMTQLVSFSVSSNALEGQMPSSILRLLKMERLNVENNYLSGMYFPNYDFDGGLLGPVKYLHLGNNEFTGTIGAAIGLLTNLVELDISKNQMKSHLPTEFGLMTSLTSLHLNGNQFDDSIPTEMGLLSNLEEMILHHNLFTGTLPPDICQLPNLQRDDLTVDCARVFCLCCHCGPRNKDDESRGDKLPPTNGGSPEQGIPPPPMNGGGSGSRP